MALKITIGTKANVYETIGHTDDFKPVLWYKVGKRKQAIEDLTSFYNRFQEVFATGIEFNDEEYQKFSNQFENKARIKAMQTIERIEENETMHEGKFFTYLS